METTEHNGFKISASNNGIYNIIRMFDKNPNTSWITYTVPSSVIIEFDKERSFVGMVLVNSANTSAVFKDYQIEISSDGNIYEVITAGTQPSSYPLTCPLIFRCPKPISAKYVKVTFETSYDNGFDINAIHFI